MVSLVQAMIGIMVVILIGVLAVIPTVTQAISDSNITGTAATLMLIVPTLLAIVLVAAVASLIR